jgi:hypothetical protein
MQMKKESIPKKCYTQKRPREGFRTRWIYQIRKDIEIRGENFEEIEENWKWENRDFSLIVDPQSLEMT